MTDQTVNLEKFDNPAAPAPQNALALISLIVSIASFVFLPIIGALTGVITGHIALRQIRMSGEQGRTAATWGLILGYVHIALALLAVLVFLTIFILFGISFAGVAASRGY